MKINNFLRQDKIFIKTNINIKNNLKIKQPIFMFIKFPRENTIIPLQLGNGYINSLWKI
jgi:hypothetical protein